MVGPAGVARMTSRRLVRGSGATDRSRGPACRRRATGEAVGTGPSAGREAPSAASSGPAGVCEDPRRGASARTGCGHAHGGVGSGGTLARSPHLCGRLRPNCLPERDWMGAGVHGSTACGSW